MAGKGNIRKLGARWGGRQPDFSVAVATGAAANTNIADRGPQDVTMLLIAVIEVPAATTTHGRPHGGQFHHVGRQHPEHGHDGGQSGARLLLVRLIKPRRRPWLSSP
jgi:hypothetical protein